MRTNDKAIKIANQLLKETTATECGARHKLCIDASEIIKQLVESNEFLQKQLDNLKEMSEDFSDVRLDTYRKDKEMIDYIKTNAKFFTEGVVASNLGISKKYLLLLAKELGVEFDWAELHPKMREIYPQGLPNGSQYIMDTRTDKYLIPAQTQKSHESDEECFVTHVFSMDF